MNYGILKSVLISCLVLTSVAKAAPTVFVNDEAGFNAQVAAQSLALVGTEDWESSTQAPGTLVFASDPIQPGVPNGPFPAGTAVSTGMIVQSNTNATAGLSLLPRGTDALAVAAPGFDGTPTHQLSTSFGVDSLDLIFGAGVMAVSLTPLYIDTANFNALGSISIRIFDTTNTEITPPGGVVINGVDYQSANSFVGIVAMAGQPIGRLNIFDGNVDLSKITGVDNVDVYQPAAPAPDIEICALVTLNPDMVSDFSDADNIAGDGCDSFSQNSPVGVVGAVDGTYRLKVTNTGTESLVLARINAPDFGLIDASIPCNGGMLGPGETCIINFDDPGFPTLKVPGVCMAPGHVNKIATVDANGVSSGIPVSDDDPAVVQCVAEPDISLRKEVSLNGGPFVDANTPASGPTGPLFSDAEYRLIVENTGTQTLENAVISDPSLGLVNVPVPGSDLLPGEIVVVTSIDAGFGPLIVEDRCTSVGTFLNIASVDARAALSGTAVNDDDPAYVNCESPMVQLAKQVSLDGTNFFDANGPGDPDVPVGIVGLTDATYRLVVANTGSESLTSVTVEDATLGISQVIPDLVVGEARILQQFDAGFGNLLVPMRCDGTPGNKSNIATISARGALSGTPVSDDDPANVRCIIGAGIELLKQVALDGVNYFDADTAAAGPTGMLGADATYRLIVRNVGDEDLVSVSIEDTTLGISGETIPDLPVGAEVVIGVGSFGKFQELFSPNRCDADGTKLNIAQVSASGAATGTLIQDDDSAFVNCEGGPPVASNLSISPNPVAVAGAVLITADIDDSTTGGSNIVSAAYTIDGSGPTPMTAVDGSFDSPTESVVGTSPAFLAAGVFEICVSGVDAHGDTSNEVCEFVVVYDPSAGFVTGGGWFDSPPGAYVPNSSLTGKANFGFVSRYKKGQSIPVGGTEFRFQAGGFNFQSLEYDWLIVNGGGAKAQFKGIGTVNGNLDSNGNPFKFIVWATDSEPDTFRIRIWSEIDDVETDVYDNGFDQAISGGSIVIHTKRTK